MTIDAAGRVASAKDCARSPNASLGHTDTDYDSLGRTIVKEAIGRAITPSYTVDDGARSGRWRSLVGQARATCLVTWNDHGDARGCGSTMPTGQPDLNGWTFPMTPKAG